MRGASGPFGVLNQDLLLELKEQHPNLKALNLSHNQLVSTDGLGVLDRLEKLDLSHNQLQELGLEPFPHLKELEAGCNALYVPCMGQHGTQSHAWYIQRSL